MLPLELRPEFRTKHMRGTAIELRNRQNSGWAQRDPSELLRITYPTVDVQRSLRIPHLFTMWIASLSACRNDSFTASASVGCVCTVSATSSA